MLQLFPLFNFTIIQYLSLCYDERKINRKVLFSLHKFYWLLIPIHTMKNKKVTTNNKILTIYKSTTALNRLATSLILLKSLSAIKALSSKELPTPKHTAPASNHSFALSKDTPPVGIIGM